MCYIKEKIIVALILVLLPNVLCLSDEMKELIKQLHDTCLDETGTTEDAIKDANSGIFSEEQSFKCYTKCLLDQMALVDDDGIIDVEAAVAMLPEDMKESIPVMRKCGTQKGNDPCDNVWLTNKCHYKENPKIYVLM